MTDDEFPDPDEHPMFFKVLTLYYRPDTAAVLIRHMPGTTGLKEAARHRLLDKLHEVLDPDDTWRS